MGMTGSVGHISDLPILFLYVVKKESFVAKKRGTVLVEKNLLLFSKIKLE